MGKVIIQGDSSPTGILRHWERKTKAECAREILRCWEERDRLLQKIDDLEAARSQDEPIGFIEQDEIDSLRDGCSFAAIRKEEDRQDMTPAFFWPSGTRAQVLEEVLIQLGHIEIDSPKCRAVEVQPTSRPAGPSNPPRFCVLNSGHEGPCKTLGGIALEPELIKYKPVVRVCKKCRVKWPCPDAEKAMSIEQLPVKGGE